MKIISIILGVFSLFGLIFISSEFLSRLIGATLLAFFADINADRYIVINPSTTEVVIAAQFVLNKIPFMPSNKNSPSIAPTICKSIYIANTPEIIPIGTPY